MRRNFLLIVLIAFVAACDRNGSISGKDLMPEMAQTDSLELIYFRSPDSPRFFTYMPVTDKELISALVTDVSGKIQPENQCIKEGKIYCFKKGEIFNTIFFAYTASDCNVLRYIKNGKLYYFPLSDALSKKLGHYKLTAREPSVEAAAALLSNNK
jgi:hypothetical protein